jgi:hypothetical protein
MDGFCPDHWSISQCGVWSFFVKSLKAHIFQIAILCVARLFLLVVFHYIEWLIIFPLWSLD